MIVAALVLSALLASGSSRADSAAAVSPQALFESYARGDYGTVEAVLKLVDNRFAFIDAIKRDAKTWTRLPDDPETAARRRLIVATVALEAVYRPRPPATVFGLGTATPEVIAGPYANLHDLTEWACSLVRQNPIPGPAERLWHWLSLALLEDDAVHAPLEVHVRHALDRFPNEPRFILARAIAAELRTSPDERGRSPRDRDRNATDTLVARLEAAEAIDSVRPEASLRHAFLLLRLGQPEAGCAAGRARRRLGRSFLIYLAWLFRGRALDALGRTDDAIAAYREAAVVVPHAQTADMALAAALAKQGRRSEAAAIALASLTSEAAIVDPWRMYGAADARVWRRIRDALRQELRR